MGILRYFTLPGVVTSLSEINFSAQPLTSQFVTELSYDVGTDEAFYQGGPADFFAVQYSGEFNVSTDGVYTYYLTSDDGSVLLIDGEQVVSNDGDHSAVLQTGSVNLSAGVHSIEVRYFENDGFATLDLDWSGPGFGRTQMQFDATVPPVPDPPQDPPASDALVANYFALPGVVTSLSEVNFSAQPTSTQFVTELAYDAGTDEAFYQGGPADFFAARYSGAFDVSTDGVYTLLPDQ